MYVPKVQEIDNTASCQSFCAKKTIFSHLQTDDSKRISKKKGVGYNFNNVSWLGGPSFQIPEEALPQDLREVGLSLYLNTVSFLLQLYSNLAAFLEYH